MDDKQKSLLLKKCVRIHQILYKHAFLEDNFATGKISIANDMSISGKEDSSKVNLENISLEHLTFLLKKIDEINKYNIELIDTFKDDEAYIQEDIMKLGNFRIKSNMPKIDTL